MDRYDDDDRRLTRGARAYSAGDGLDDDQRDLDTLRRYTRGGGFDDDDDDGLDVPTTGGGYNGGSRHRRRRGRHGRGGRWTRTSGDAYPGEDVSDDEAGLEFPPRHPRDDDDEDPFVAEGEFDDEEPEMAPAPFLGEEVEVPIEWKVARFPFRIEVQLDKLQRTQKAGIEIDFDAAASRRNLAVQDFLASGAYLGEIHVRGLRHNGPVSLAVRGESKVSGESLSLVEPTTFLASVKRPVHGILSKRVTTGTDIVLRKDVRVSPTWLSGYPAGWAVTDLGKKIKTTLDPAVLEVSTDHPVAHLLETKGILSAEDMANRPSVHVNKADVAEARKELEREEADNPKVADARNLRLVLVRAHGTLTNAGAPDWTDKEELADDYAADQRKAAVLDARRRSPIVIEGAWEIMYGHPAPESEIVLDL